MKRHLARLVALIKESRFASLGLKSLGVLACVIGLGIVGSGLFDRWIKPAKASAAPAATMTDTTVPALPSLADPTPPGSSDPPAEPTGAASASGPSCDVVDGKVVLNVATAEELRKVQGIGKAKAEAIVELRAKLGKFTRLEDLYRIKGIKRKLLEKIRPNLMLDPPPDCAKG
jgi:competence protein ComEA